MITGYVCSSLASKLFDMPTSVPTWAVFLSFAVCTLIGVAFGYIPAKKAANLDPIGAMRHK